MQNTKKLLIIVVILSILSSFGSIVFYEIIKENNNSQTSESYDYSKNNQVAEEITNKNLSNLKTLENSVKSISSQVNSSVVNIIVSKDIQTYRTDPFGFFTEPLGTVKKEVGGGTGFFVDKNGLILTNKHVVSDPNADYTIITASGDEFVAKILAYDPTNDLALVKAFSKEGKEVKNTPAVKFITDTNNIEVGSFALAIGNALAQFKNTLTFGIISGLGRNIEAGDQGGNSSEQLTGLIQTDTAINPGNSGGPLVNLNGEVMGINTAIAAGANGLGFAIPLSQKEVNFIIKSVEKFGKIKRPYIGIKYISLNPNIAKALKLTQTSGDYINGENNSGVLPNSPASLAGLQNGDIITEVNGEKLIAGKSIKDIIKDKLPGEEIIVKIIRSGQEKVLNIRLGETN